MTETELSEKIAGLTENGDYTAHHALKARRRL